MTGSIYVGFGVLSDEESGLVLFGVQVAGRLEAEGEIAITFRLSVSVFSIYSVCKF
jgi:hypothetical protein